MEDENVCATSDAVRAMRLLQEQMRGEAEAAGVASEEDVTSLINSIREED